MSDQEVRVAVRRLPLAPGNSSRADVVAADCRDCGRSLLLTEDWALPRPALDEPPRGGRATVWDLAQAASAHRETCPMGAPPWGGRQPGRPGDEAPELAMRHDGDGWLTAWCPGCPVPFVEDGQMRFGSRRPTGGEAAAMPAYSLLARAATHHH